MDSAQGYTLKIFEGEKDQTKDCKFLCNAELKGYSPVIRNRSQFEIRFSVDINGILSIVARELVMRASPIKVDIASDSLSQ